MLIIFPKEYCLTRSATKLNWYYQKCKSLCVTTQVKNILGPSLVYVKCVLRNHAFRIAAAARTRDSQMRVTIDTRRFSANSTNARTMGRTHARTLRSVRELFFSFFSLFFSFFSFCEVITGVQYRRCFSRRYATTRAFLQLVQSSVFQCRWHLTRKQLKLLFIYKVKSVKAAEDFFRKIYKWYNIWYLKFRGFFFFFISFR